MSSAEQTVAERLAEAERVATPYFVRRALDAKDYGEVRRLLQNASPLAFMNHPFLLDEAKRAVGFAK